VAVRASKLYASRQIFDLISSCITTIVMNEIIYVYFGKNKKRIEKEKKPPSK